MKSFTLMGDQEKEEFVEQVLAQLKKLVPKDCRVMLVIADEDYRSAAISDDFNPQDIPSILHQLSVSIARELAQEQRRMK